MRKPKRQKPLNDLKRSHTPLDVNHTLIAVVELSQKTWLVAGIIPGVERQPLKKLEPGESVLLKLPPMARRGGEDRAQDHTRRRCLRGWPGRFLAGAVAPGPRYRGARHSRLQRGGTA